MKTKIGRTRLHAYLFLILSFVGGVALLSWVWSSNNPAARLMKNFVEAIFVAFWPMILFMALLFVGATTLTTLAATYRKPAVVLALQSKLLNETVSSHLIEDNP